MSAYEDFIKFLNTIIYIFQMGIYSVTYIIALFGYFIKGFFEQFKFIGSFFINTFNLIKTFFNAIGKVFGFIIGIIIFLFNLADNGNEELF